MGMQVYRTRLKDVELATLVTFSDERGDNNNKRKKKKEQKRTETRCPKQLNCTDCTSKTVKHKI